MARIRLTPYWIEIIAKASEPEFASLISHVPNIHKTRRTDTYCCSRQLLPEVLKYLRGVGSVEDLPDGAARRALEKELYRVAATKELKEHGTDVKYPGLWDHQNLGVALAEVNDRYNFFYDTRTGKTRMAYQIMKNALQRGSAKRCIVFTPSTIIKSWLADAAEAFPELKVVAFYGNEADKEYALQTPSHVIIWSEGMVTNYMDLLKSIKFDIAFFDESSKIKSHRSKLSASILEFCLMVPRWYNLSATPAPNNESEYYTQMRTVDPYAFNPLRTYFINKYFDNMSRNRNYEKLKLKPYMSDEFEQIIDSVSIYVDQSVMPTREKIWHTVPFTLADDTYEIYDQMRKDLATEAEGKEILAETAAAMRSKLCQITSSFVLDTEAIHNNSINKKLGVKDRETETYDAGSRARLGALDSLLRGTIGADEPCIIWAHYAREFEDISVLLNFRGKKYAVLRGGTSTADKNDAISRFKAGELQYLICHPLSVGMGINLTEAHNAVYYRVTDSWEALKQSSERIFGHVSVQPHDCHYWVLLAKTPDGKTTVDSLVYDNVCNKRDASTGLLEYLKGAYYD